MVRVLLEEHESVARKGRTMLPAFERSGDQATFDLVVQRLTAHEKAAWMLRSILA